MRIDRCLDHGGAWDYGKKECSYDDRISSLSAIDLSRFFDVEHNRTYLYKIVDSYETDKNAKPMVAEKYMEKEVTKSTKQCIVTKNYLLFKQKDMPRLDTQLKAAMKENKLRIMDERYCAKGDTIWVNGTTMVNLKKNWTINYQTASIDNNAPKSNKAVCRVLDIEEKMVLGKKRKIIHTRCISQNTIFAPIDWYFAEKIGLYKMKTVFTDKISHIRSTNEIVLVGAKELLP